MKIEIKRFDGSDVYIEEYDVNQSNILNALEEIKINHDSSFTYRCGCKSGVCGSCAIRVNGIEKLACKTHLNENDIIEPIKNCKVIKDLITDVSHETYLIKKTKSFIEIKQENNDINQDDINLIDLQSNCILCNSCYSSCPIYEVNKDFLGPFILTKSLRYIEDKKRVVKNDILNIIQENGIWDCTLCSACTLVCPQGIDPKADIIKLQNISVQNGYENPNFKNLNSFDFNEDFGFNPNSF